MVRIMISQPMAGKTTREINDERRMIELEYCKDIPDYEIMDTTVKNHEEKTALECFSESILFMSKADLLLMAPGWENSRGCSLEHDIALAYDVPIIYAK